MVQFLPATKEADSTKAESKAESGNVRAIVLFLCWLE
jgi:hypothetical protein